MAEIELKSIKVQNAETTSTMTLDDICKICHCSSEESGMPLITPCLCAGSIKFVHQECLMKWMKSSTSKTCELCKHKITTDQKMKPFTEWERVNGTKSECGDLLRKACGLIIVAFLVAIMMWGSVKSMESWNKYGDDSLLWAGCFVFGNVLIAGMLMLMGSMCCDCIGIHKKWKAQNSIVVVQEVPQV